MPRPVSTDEPDQALSRALAAIERGDPALALQASLAAWRSLGDPELAAVVELLSSRCAAQLPAPIAAAGAGELEWLRRVANDDARELAVLLPLLVQTTVGAARRRMQALSARVPDPRIATAMAEQLERLPYTATGGAFYTATHRLLRGCADVRGIPRLRALVGTFSARLVGTSTAEIHERQLAATLAELEELARDRAPVGPGLAAQITALREAIDAQTDDPKLGLRLLEQIRAEPDHDLHRQVYADWLLARGDPLGEFIALQLSGAQAPLDRHGRARVRALEREHGRTWMGVLHWLLVRDSTQFARGFVVAGRISNKARAPASFAGAPEWATVERLAAAPLEILVDPIMVALREVRCDEVVAAALLGHPRPLPRITTLFVTIDWPDHGGWAHADELRAALLAPIGLPNLREVGLCFGFTIGLSSLSWLWTGGLPASVEAITIELVADSPVRLATLLASLRQSTRGPAALHQVTVVHGDFRYRFACGPDDRRWDRLTIEGPARRLEQLTATLATFIDHGTALPAVEIDPRLRDHSDAALATLLARLPLVVGP